MKKISLLITTLLIIITSCNKIDTSHEVFEFISPVVITSWDPEYAQTVIQKIYIEEFTGHQCTYCPSGARELKAIMDEDPTIIATAIHCSNLANPGSNPPFDKNFKTPMGNQIYTDLNIQALPQATFNRLEIAPNEWGSTSNKWRERVAEIDRNNIRAGVELQCTVNESNQEIEAQVAVTIIKELPNPVQLCVVLQQDSIVSGQTDGSQYILDYVHNHMLRTGFNGTYGTKLTSTGIVEPQLKYATTFKISYKNSFPYSYIPLDIKHCSVVAYVIDVETKEIVQVEAVHLR